MRIILVGKAASGKDAIKKILIGKGLSPEVSYTSRPKRDGEVDGKDYHFISKNEFVKCIADGVFYQRDYFNEHYYGTTRVEWEIKDLFIMSPSGISKILPEDRESCLVLYIHADYDVLISRLYERFKGNSKVDELVSKRMAFDDLAFHEFTDYDIMITNDGPDKLKF